MITKVLSQINIIKYQVPIVVSRQTENIELLVTGSSLVKMNYSVRFSEVEGGTNGTFQSFSHSPR